MLLRISSACLLLAAISLGGISCANDASTKRTGDSIDVEGDRVTRSVVYVQLSDDELTSNADVIVLGTVSEIGLPFRGVEIGEAANEEMVASGFSEEEMQFSRELAREEVFTPYTITVEKHFKGPKVKKGEVVTAHLWGEILDGVRYESEDTGLLDVGTRAIFFLEESYVSVYEPIGIYEVEGSGLRGVFGANRDRRTLTDMEMGIAQRLGKP